MPQGAEDPRAGDGGAPPTRIVRGHQLKVGTNDAVEDFPAPPVAPGFGPLKPHLTCGLCQNIPERGFRSERLAELDEYAERSLPLVMVEILASVDCGHAPVGSDRCGNGMGRSAKKPDNIHGPDSPSPAIRVIRQMHSRPREGRSGKAEALALTAYGPSRRAASHQKRTKAETAPTRRWESPTPVAPLTSRWPSGHADPANGTVGRFHGTLPKK
ncbi:hypothetical protein Acsp04_40380 [Actinomadura sp. NBRC 104425]|nr:hypothetical protein Acsp04_40380 [Actinomadura sp. NBRC 104425]